MYDFLSLQLKCPNCNASLMDADHPIDNEPGIRLLVECEGNRGTIRLSSIYGSYNYSSDIELPKDSLARFFCPSCTLEITSDNTCVSCDAPIVPFYLDMGGKVSICSRSGCKNHFVEFEDLSNALKKLYQDYGFGAHHTNSGKRPEFSNKEKPWDKKKEVIESGTFLQAYCPHCKKSLIEEEMLKLKIINGEEGYLLLSPYLNVFSSISTIYLPEDKTVTDVKCFHCDTSLILTDRHCDRCYAPVARIAVTARTKLIDFFICTKKGCKWHGLSEEDLNDIRLEDVLEW